MPRSFHSQRLRTRSAYRRREPQMRHRPAPGFRGKRQLRVQTAAPDEPDYLPSRTLPAHKDLRQEEGQDEDKHGGDDDGLSGCAANALRAASSPQPVKAAYQRDGE